VPVVLRSEKQHGAESKMHGAWTGDVSTKEMNATLRSGYNLPKQTKNRRIARLIGSSALTGGAGFISNI
jgi:hypothetical protein